VKLSKEEVANVRRSDLDYEPPPLLAPGVYDGVLWKVTERKNAYGAWWWDWAFAIAGDERLVHFYVSLRRGDTYEFGLQKMRQAFDAFGVSPDTDTDELNGRKVRLEVVQREDRYGVLGNRVDRVLPKD
jgi:hypothetical protein